MEEVEMEIDIQVDAAGRPSNLAAGGWGCANREASVRFIMPGAQKIPINHCDLFVLCSSPGTFKIKVMEAKAKITTAREEELQALNTSLQEDGHAVLRTSEPEGTRQPSASEADQEDVSVRINTLPAFISN